MSPSLCRKGKLLDWSESQVQASQLLPGLSPGFIRQTVARLFTPAGISAGWMTEVAVPSDDRFRWYFKIPIQALMGG